MSPLRSIHPHKPFASFWWIGIFSIVLLVAVFCMGYALDVFPGLNGDEAYQALLGEPWNQAGPGDLGISGRYSHWVLLALIRSSLWCFGHSIAAIRIPAVLLTLAGLTLIFSFSRQNTRPFAAWLMVLVFATHPMILGYARLGWEPAGALLGASLVWFPLFVPEHRISPLARWGAVTLGSMLTFLAHPLYVINLLAMVAVAVWHRSSAFPATWQRWTQRGIVLAALLPVLGMAGFLAHSFGGLFVFHVFLNYFTYLGEIVSGIRIFQYVVGIPWAWMYGCQIVVFSVIFALSWVNLYRHDRQACLWTIGVILLSLAGFFVIQPWYPIGLGNSRFMLFLLCPVLFGVARGLALYPPRQGAILALVYAIMGLTSFGWSYFREGWRTENRQAAHTFWSGSDAQDPEPKTKAAQWIQQHTSPSTAILVSSFWMEKPLGFLLKKHILYYWHPLQKLYYPRPWRRFSWVIVGFADEPGIAFLQGYFRQQNIPYQRKTIRSRRGHAQIVLLYHAHPQPPSRR